MAVDLAVEVRGATAAVRRLRTVSVAIDPAQPRLACRGPANKAVVEVPMVLEALADMIVQTALMVRVFRCDVSGDFVPLVGR